MGGGVEEARGWQGGGGGGVVDIKSAWLALRVDVRLYNIKANSFLSKLTLELRVFERVCALIIYF